MIITKILCPFLPLLFLVSIISSCNNEDAVSDDSDPKPELVTQDFEATFLGTYTYAGPDTMENPKCTGELSDWRAIVDCEGTSDVMGDLSIHFDFCGHLEGHYGNTYAYMVDHNSDTLFVSCEGQVIQGKLDEHPSYVTSYWKDTFKILGGTGRFAGATGSGMTDDFNSAEDPNSHHHWKGTITMSKSE